MQDKEQKQEDQYVRIKPEGCRVSPSQFESLSYIYDKFKDSDELTILKNLRNESEIEEKKILENAHWAIYGTQIHALTYYYQLFQRSEYLNRQPTLNDFKNTFPYHNNDYYYGLLKLLDLTDLNTNNQSQAYWNEWRMNGQDFTPLGHTNYTVSPDKIRDMWENGTIPLKDLQSFFNNTSRIPDKNLNPNKTLLINEVLSISNIFFNDSNLQVPTVIDEICIPEDFPKSPIQIIDYKTGKQFKKPEFKEKIQIFLMMSAVLVNVLDKAYSVKFGLNEWDIVHNTRDFPFFTKRNLRNNLIGNIYFYEIINCVRQLNENIKFAYVNPITQERIDINTEDVYLDSEKSIKDILMYLNNVNKFYIKHKDVVKKALHTNKYLYTLPIFPTENFFKDTVNNKVIQLSLI